MCVGDAATVVGVAAAVVTMSALQSQMIPSMPVQSLAFELPTGATLESVSPRACA